MNQFSIPEKVDRVMSGGRRALILMHDNPDPDAIASSYAMQHLLRDCYQLVSDIAYGGLISRAENRAMVRILKIQIKKSRYIRWQKYDRIILLDTQPGAGNNSLPPGAACHLVIDHHPRRRGLKSEIDVIVPHVGATATIMTQWLQQRSIEISVSLATALSYAIRSETQDLGRETTEHDIQAYLSVFPKSSMRSLAHIAYPRLSDDYYETLSEALEKSRVYRNIMCIHMGDIPYPEIAAEMADLLLRRRGTSWCLCTGYYRTGLYLSLRASAPGADAGKVIKRCVPDRNMAGGHKSFAGGRVILEDGGADLEEVEARISRRFAGVFGYEDAVWKSLLGNTDDP
jgi:nanoRNase/pAp phosphatase (c-di-AMP/oligoRNAs hydrolase)